MTLAADDVKVIEKCWDKIRMDVRNRWPQLDHADLEMIDGDSRKLIALIHQRTGTGLSEIGDAIDEIASRSGGLLERVVKTAASGGSVISDQATQSAATVFQEITNSLCVRPGRTLGIVFGAAFAIGFLTTCFTGLNASGCGSGNLSRWFDRN